MALNPIVFTEKVVRSFLRYQLTAYPFASTEPGITTHISFSSITGGTDLHRSASSSMPSSPSASP